MISKSWPSVELAQFVPFKFGEKKHPPPTTNDVFVGEFHGALPWSLESCTWSSTQSCKKSTCTRQQRTRVSSSGGWWRESNQPGRLGKFQVWGDVDLENGSNLYLMGQSEGERRGWIIGIVGKMLGDARASDEKDVAKIETCRICGTATASCGRRWGHSELVSPRPMDFNGFQHATLIKATCDSDPVETVVFTQTHGWFHISESRQSKEKRRMWGWSVATLLCSESNNVPSRPHIGLLKWK